jgi:ABC-2 type transport system permease protein
MTGRSVALRAGWSRGLVELRQSFTHGSDLFGHLFWPVALLVVMFFMRDATFGSTSLSLSALMLPSVMGMNVVFAGMLTMSQFLAAEREDGTLLRAKALPNGMQGYLLGKIISVSGMLVAAVLLVLIPGAFIVPGLALDSAGSWLTLLWVLALGMVATLPLGAVLGSLFTSARSLSVLFLPIIGLIAISGVFYPITGLPVWLQWVGQGFPVYWLALGMRSALLPDAAASVEIGESWRTLETVGVLGAWAVLGLLLAPVVLRRMARRESGSAMTERREMAMQRLA